MLGFMNNICNLLIVGYFIQTKNQILKNLSKYTLLVT